MQISRCDLNISCCADSATALDSPDILLYGRPGIVFIQLRDLLQILGLEGR